MAIPLKLESPGPLFFKQKRVGRMAVCFYIHKLRSMYMDAEERKKELMAQNEMNGLMFKMQDDPRITKVGKFIRKTSIDELPQFFDVLRGDMSLVGTRPPTLDEYKQYESHHKRRLSMKPGITGLWQVSGRSDIEDFEEVVKLDVQYSTSMRGMVGSGSIPKLLAQLALPAVVAQVVNLLYNIVDRIYIGHMPEVGASALTGVGLFTPILMLITAFAMLCGSGGAPRAAIAMGRGDDDAAEKIMGNCFTLLLILAAVLTVVFYFAAPCLLVLFGASDKTLPYALDYARIYIIGTVFVLIVMGMNPFVTTQGFATLSMMTTVIGAVCNIILDPS